MFPGYLKGQPRTNPKSYTPNPKTPKLEVGVASIPDDDCEDRLLLGRGIHGLRALQVEGFLGLGRFKMTVFWASDLCRASRVQCSGLFKYLQVLTSSCYFLRSVPNLLMFSR